MYTLLISISTYLFYLSIYLSILDLSGETYGSRSTFGLFAPGQKYRWRCARVQFPDPWHGVSSNNQPKQLTKAACLMGVSIVMRVPQ